MTFQPTHIYTAKSARRYEVRPLIPGADWKMRRRTGFLFVHARVGDRVAAWSVDARRLAPIEPCPEARCGGPAGHQNACRPGCEALRSFLDAAAPSRAPGCAESLAPGAARRAPRRARPRAARKIA